MQIVNFDKVLFGTGNWFRPWENIVPNVNCQYASLASLTDLLSYRNASMDVTLKCVMLCSWELECVPVGVFI